jgi:hypothetical protein
MAGLAVLTFGMLRSLKRPVSGPIVRDLLLRSRKNTDEVTGSIVDASKLTQLIKRGQA